MSRQDTPAKARKLAIDFLLPALKEKKYVEIIIGESLIQQRVDVIVRVYLPWFVNEVHAERVSREFHQPIHGNIKVTVTFLFTGIEGQPVIHKATGIPAKYAYTHKD